MVNRQEAERIASAITILRGDWPKGLIMAVLGDDRCIHRGYADLAVALTCVAVDPQSKKPGRIHEPGPWWNATLATLPGPRARELSDDDCDICTHPKWSHPLVNDPHEFQPRSDRSEGVGPTDEQRAAFEAARIEAEKLRTAERKEKPVREPRDSAAVIQSHLEEKSA